MVVGRSTRVARVAVVILAVVLGVAVVVAAVAVVRSRALAQQVGALTQYLPVRGGNRTTSFSFSYTFAPEDATLGKISFQAVATVQSARDAIPTDNTFISLPTTVH